jgi:hypothetical protein
VFDAEDDGSRTFDAIRNALVSTGAQIVFAEGEDEARAPHVAQLVLRDRDGSTLTLSSQAGGAISVVRSE